MVKKKDKSADHLWWGHQMSQPQLVPQILQTFIVMETFLKCKKGKTEFSHQFRKIKNIPADMESYIRATLWLKLILFSNLQ